MSCACVLPTANTCPRPPSNGVLESCTYSGTYLLDLGMLKMKYLDVWLRDVNASLMVVWLLS